MAENRLDEFNKLVLGPRVRHEIERRIRELLNRPKPRIYERAEIERLRELLKNQGGDNDA